MPEGHTAHRIARDQQELVGRVLAASSPQGRFAGGARQIDGSLLTGITAKGKHLFHHFDPAVHLHIHLGMQGKFLRDESGRSPLRQARLRLEAPDPPVAWELVAPSRCELLDGAGLAAMCDRLGPDPLAPGPEYAGDVAAEASTRLGSDDRPIGEVLLDQSVISGVGNVFRAEVLFLCGVHPRRPGTSLTTGELECLWSTLRETMGRAVDEGRILTVPTAAGVDRASLAESEARFVYKQARCRRCGTAVDIDEIGGRTSYACPRCQPPGGP